MAAVDYAWKNVLEFTNIVATARAFIWALHIYHRHKDHSHVSMYHVSDKHPHSDVFTIAVRRDDSNNNTATSLLTELVIVVKGRSLMYM